MADIIPYPVIIEKKIEKTEKQIKDVILDSEEIIELTICEICDNIMDPEDIDEGILKDLQNSICDWFEIQRKKGEKNIL